MMRTIFLLVALVLCGCRAGESKDDGPRLIRITEEIRGLFSHESHLLAKVRGDSSADRAFIDRLWTQHHDSFPEDQRMNYGPDSGFTQIEMVRGQERIVVGSWHTVEQTYPDLFADHHGLGTLGDRTRDEALAAEPKAYRKFRASFDAIVDAVTTYKKQ